jgi:hypothetical protein
MEKTEEDVNEIEHESHPPKLTRKPTYYNAANYNKVTKNENKNVVYEVTILGTELIHGKRKTSYTVSTQTIFVR